MVAAPPYGDRRTRWWPPGSSAAAGRLPDVAHASRSNSAVPAARPRSAAWTSELDVAVLSTTTGEATSIAQQTIGGRSDDDLRAGRRRDDRRARRALAPYLVLTADGIAAGADRHRMAGADRQGRGRGGAAGAALAPGSPPRLSTGRASGSPRIRASRTSRDARPGMLDVIHDSIDSCCSVRCVKPCSMPLAVVLPVAVQRMRRSRPRALRRAAAAALGPPPGSVATSTAVPVWSALGYEGVARRVLLAYKDGGRTDAAPALARALRRDRGRAGARARPRGSATARRSLLVTIPSTRAAFRRRGYHPTALLLARAHILCRRAARAAARRARRPTRRDSRRAERARQPVRDRSRAAAPAGRTRVPASWSTTSSPPARPSREAARAIRCGRRRVVGRRAIARTPLRGGGNAQRTSSRRSGECRLFSGIGTGRTHYGGRKGVDDPPFVIRADGTPDQGGRHGHQHHRTQPGHH